MVSVLGCAPAPAARSSLPAAARAAPASLPEPAEVEALRALTAGRARVFPGLKIAAAALVISAIPIGLMRIVMARRPRRV